MKPLFFDAAVSRPKAAPAVMGQASRTLRPFNQFLGQAIHTAKQRQVRYQLPWERVRDLHVIRVERLDSVLRIPRRLPGIAITNWPADRQPDLAQHAFVINRGVPITIEAATTTARGLLVRANPAVLPTDRLVWCGIECDFAQEAAKAPREVCDLEGRPVTLLASPRADGDSHWLLLIEGQHGDCDLCVDGEGIEAEAVRVTDGPRQLVDSAGRSLEVRGPTLRVEELPADGPLRDGDGVRYRWETARRADRRGNWVQLLPPETSDAEEFLDPRAAFCEGDVDEVWTQARHDKRTVFKVKRIDQDRYQLCLDRLPPADTTLYLPVDLRNLYLQKRALRQLSEAPLPHHRGLLRLCEDPGHVRWPRVTPDAIADDAWRSLTDATRSGTLEQRAFVDKALGSPDFAFLEGPPGSGKTTAICEIVQQLVERGQRVLLCASTHVAIDNVLERLLASDSPIDAVRVGRLERVDDKVQEAQLDARIDALVSQWKRLPAMSKLGDGELAAMAGRTVIMAANLTCGTTMGIVNHPLFRGRDEDLHVSERPITTMPHWDVLIVDEASKTLIQEFMVPALMARRWIIVGDVRQLPPFADRADIVANLRDLVDDRDRPVFPLDHQRACLLRYRLLRPDVRQPGMRWLIVEPPGVLRWLARELDATPALSVVRVAAHDAAPDGPVATVTVAQLQTGSVEALRVAAADWVLVSDDLLPEVSHLLPSNLLHARDLATGPGPLPEGDPLHMRQAWWLQRARRLSKPYFERKHRRPRSGRSRRAGRRAPRCRGP